MAVGPDDGQAKAVEIAKLTMAFPSQGQEGVPNDLRAGAYFDALDGLPAWAVADARRKVVAGRTPYGDPWAPTPAQLRKLVSEILTPLRGELHVLESIEAAEQESKPSDAERRRVIAQMDQFRAELAGNAAKAEARGNTVCGYTTARTRARMIFV